MSSCSGRSLPTNLVADIGYLAGYYESLVLLGPRIFDFCRFRVLLLLQGGPAQILETIIKHGKADIRTLVNIKPLIPRRVALSVAIGVTQDVSVIKRVCLIWKIYHCDFAYKISQHVNFVWGMKHLRKTLSYDPHDTNRAYAAIRQFEKMDFTLIKPLQNVEIDTWLCKKMGGDCFLDTLSLYTICAYERGIDSEYVRRYLHKKLNRDTEKKLDFGSILCDMLLGRRFKQIKQLYEYFADEYESFDPDTLKTYVRNLADRTMWYYEEEEKIEFADLMLFLKIPHYKVYNALLFLEVKDIVRFVRLYPTIILPIFEKSKLTYLLTYSPLIDKLRDREYEAVRRMIYDEYPIPRSVNEDSSDDDIDAFFALASYERKLEMIRNGLVNHFSDMVDLLYSEYYTTDIWECIKAFVDLHGSEMLATEPFHLLECTEQQFSWLVGALVLDKVVEKGTSSENVAMFHPVHISGDTVKYTDFTMIDSQDLTKIEFKPFMLLHLKHQLAFWNYFEDERAYFF